MGRRGQWAGIRSTRGADGQLPTRTASGEATIEDSRLLSELGWARSSTSPAWWWTSPGGSSRRPAATGPERPFLGFQVGLHLRLQSPAGERVLPFQPGIRTER